MLQELDHGGSSGGDEGLGFDLESDLPEIEVLARFELESGNVIEFQADPLTDDIGYTERFIAGESTPVFPADADISLLELYLQIAPDNAPVPKRLLDAAPDSEPLVIQEALERELVDYAGELVPRTGILGLQSPPSVVEGGGGWNCINNDTSSAFAADYCSHSGGSNKVSYCDSGSWTNLVRGNFTRTHAYSVTAFCNPNCPYSYCTGENARKYHEFYSGYWQDSYAFYPIYSGEVIFTTWGSVAALRRVRHLRNVGAYGYVRAYTVFYNN